MSSQHGDAASWKESCFTFALDTQHKRKRAKFDKSRKSEVATIRRKGACLRCRLLKASCSEVRPCENCVRAKLSSHVQVHKWMDCVSVSLKDINVFKTVLPVPSLRATQSLDLEHISEVPIFLCGESRVVWSLDWLAGHISTWVEDRKSLGFSRTGILASSRLQSLLEPLLGSQISSSLRSLVLSTLLVYNLGQDAGMIYVHRHLEAFHRARATHADNVLRFLEATLTASFLTRPLGDPKRIQALIILAFGVMRSLAYLDDSEIRRHAEVRRAGQGSIDLFYNVAEMRDQLSGTLAHFLVLLIDRLGNSSLGDKLPTVLGNVQAHSSRPFIAPLPICAPACSDSDAVPPTDLQADIFGPSDPAVYSEFPLHWVDTVGEPQFANIGSPMLEDGGDLQQMLSNDLDALNNASCAENKSDGVDPYRQCIVCTSPLPANEFDALCFACQQPPYEAWPGNKTFESNDSSLNTAESSRIGIQSGLNSLSTSMTSQESTFDDDMATSGRRAFRGTLPTPVEEADPVAVVGRRVFRGTLPTPFEEMDPVEEIEEDPGWPFEAEDMDFGVAPPDVENDEFPPGWSLYWDDSCDEQSVQGELEVF